MAVYGRNRNVYVDGIEDLVKFFEKNAEAAEEVLDNACEYAAKEIVKPVAIQKTPVRTGKLRNSIEVEKVKSKKQSRKTWKIYTKGERKGGVRYGFAVEGGTKKDKAQPFLRPAVDQNKDKIEQTISDKIKEGLKRVR